MYRLEGDTVLNDVQLLTYPISTLDPSCNKFYQCFSIIYFIKVYLGRHLDGKLCRNPHTRLKRIQVHRLYKIPYPPLNNFKRRLEKTQVPEVSLRILPLYFRLSFHSPNKKSWETFAFIPNRIIDLDFYRYFKLASDCKSP